MKLEIEVIASDGQHLVSVGHVLDAKGLQERFRVPSQANVSLEEWRIVNYQEESISTAVAYIIYFFLFTKHMVLNNTVLCYLNYFV